MQRNCKRERDVDPKILKPIKQSKTRLESSHQSVWTVQTQAVSGCRPGPTQFPLQSEVYFWPEAQLIVGLEDSDPPCFFFRVVSCSDLLGKEGVV